MDEIHTLNHKLLKGKVGGETEVQGRDSVGRLEHLSFISKRRRKGGGEREETDTFRTE